jgi:hypothetical protein
MRITDKFRAVVLMLRIDVLDEFKFRFVWGIRRI